jgi:hypothetical protein
MGTQNQSCCSSKPAQEQHLVGSYHNKQRGKLQSTLSFPASAFNKIISAVLICDSQYDKAHPAQYIFFLSFFEGGGEGWSLSFLKEDCIIEENNYSGPKSISSNGLILEKMI